MARAVTDPDFGRGDGDPLGGPDAPGAGQPSPPDIDQAKIEFRVQRVGWATQTVVITFIDPEGEAEEHLMALWRIWHGERDARMARDGSGSLDLG